MTFALLNRPLPFVRKAIVHISRGSVEIFGCLVPSVYPALTIPTYQVPRSEVP